MKKSMWLAAAALWAGWLATGCATQRNVALPQDVTYVIVSIGGYDTDKDGNTLSLYDVLCSEDTILSQVLLEMNVKRLYELLDEVLDARERHILRLRYGLGGQKEYTQREVAQGLGISRSYVSRIEKRALAKLEEAMEDWRPD
mgnify:CR=1 FL=1